MNDACLITCEKRGTWAAALRREIDCEVHETRAVAACWREISARPHSFLVAELTPENAELLIGRLADLGRLFPGAAAVVVAQRRLRRLEWLVREAGAVHFEVSPRRLRFVAEMARRHLASAPTADLAPTQRILASLPWSSFRS
jgi:hypothetical protein